MPTFPIEAWIKWEWVWKALVFAIFLPFTLRTRLRIEACLLFLCSVGGAIVIVGGIKTVRWRRRLWRAQPDGRQQ